MAKQGFEPQPSGAKSSPISAIQTSTVSKLGPLFLFGQEKEHEMEGVGSLA